MSIIKVNDIQTTGGTSNRGRVLQVVQSNSTSTSGSTYSGSTWQTVLSATITPSSTSSKVLILAQITVGNPGTGRIEGGMRVIRGASTINIADASSSKTQASAVCWVDGNLYATNSTNYVYLDSPATTSSTTYNLQFYSSESQTFYLNYASQNSEYTIMGTTTIVLMEISGT